MKAISKKWISAAVLIGAFCLLGCDADTRTGEPGGDRTDRGAPDQKGGLDWGGASNADRPRCWVEARVEDNGQAAVTVSYARPEGRPGPRAAEIFLEHSENLVFQGATQGAAVTEADKKMAAQDRGPGKVRVVIYGPGNLNELDTGELFELRFVKKGADAAQARVATDQPLFAPEQANEGLLVGEPITL